jgi:hypothetical protein
LYDAKSSTISRNFFNFFILDVYHAL